MAPRPPDRSNVDPGVKAAALAALALVAVALIVDLAQPGLDGRDPMARATTILVTLAALCVAGLTLTRSPSLAWLASVLAAGVAATEILGGLRTAELAGARSGIDVPLATLARVTTALIAAGYATRPSRPGAGLDWGRRVAAAAFLAVVIVEAATVRAEVGAAGAPLDGWPEHVANRVLPAYVALAVAIGALLDLQRPVRIARRRLGAPLTIDRVPRLLDLLADELLPYRRTVRQEAAQRERSRLAADLHAEVLPELRAALVAANATGGPQAGMPIQAALGQLEDLMTARQSVVLESFGLVAAVESLAERIEARSSVSVELDLDDDDEDRPSARPPIEVERAALRVAGLALENVVRHAGVATARVYLAANSDRLILRISDAGSGFDPDQAVTGRGLADMHAAADGVRADLVIDARSGTTVELRWHR